MSELLAKDINEEIAELETETTEKIGVKKKLDMVSLAMSDYRNAKPEAESAASHVYDPKTDTFAKDVEPYMEDDLKKEIRDLFK